ncbi:MAG: hypothetical protein ABL916_19120 [Burkholderiaceae bacterium]
MSITTFVHHDEHGRPVPTYGVDNSRDLCRMLRDMDDAAHAGVQPAAEVEAQRFAQIAALIPGGRQ